MAGVDCRSFRWVFGKILTAEAWIVRLVTPSEYGERSKLRRKLCYLSTPKSTEVEDVVANAAEGQSDF